MDLIYDTVGSGIEFIQKYGWFVLAGTIVTCMLYYKLVKVYKKWREDMEEAALKKDPDLLLRRMEAIEKAREKQQRELEAAAAVYAQKQKELEEKRQRERAERLEKGCSGQKLGTASDGYLPLSGGASASSYKAPKKKCPGGGCGK